MVHINKAWFRKPLGVGQHHSPSDSLLGQKYVHTLGKVCIKRWSLSLWSLRLMRAIKNKCLLRYDLGNNFVYTMMIFVTKSLVLASMLFTNSIVILRFNQAVVWKRLLEFDEDLLERVITVTIYTCSTALTLVCSNKDIISSHIIKIFASNSTQANMSSSECVHQFSPFKYR